MLDFDSFLEFCDFQFCGTHNIQDSWVFIKTSDSKWKVNLNDLKRFGKITVFHRSNSNKDKETFHVQSKEKSYFRAFWKAYSHDMYKYNDIPFPTKETGDYDRFISDYWFLKRSDLI